jgi:nucleoside-diphosphate-sugar epimerase
VTNAFQALAGKRVALVGGAGFIGHHLALKLKSVGAEPHIMDGLQVNNLGAFTSGMGVTPNAALYVKFINDRLALLQAAGIPLHIVDARDYPLIGRHLEFVKPDIVVQLAAIAHANRANKDPYSTFDHSMRTLENVLDSIRVALPHLIFMSSSMVYGNFNSAAAAEDHHCEPLGIYGALKFAGEKLVIAYNQTFGLNYTIVRPSALYGERCVSRRVGQAFIENALGGKPVVINGDGNDRLDFTYIEDLVQGLMLCMVRPEAVNQVFNLTFGDARSINQMAEILRGRIPGVKISNHDRDSLMPERGTLCVDKAKQLLGYNPQFPLEKGFDNYISWYLKMADEQPGIFKN